MFCKLDCKDLIARSSIATVKWSVSVLQMESLSAKLFAPSIQAFALPAFSMDVITVNLYRIAQVETVC